MTKNEQIEEMAKTACTVFDGNCSGCSFNLYPPCPPKASAERLYSKGYRKVERGEWITPWVMKPYGKAYGTPYCSVCKQLDNEKGDFCRFCGADMRGDRDDQA